MQLLPLSTRVSLLAFGSTFYNFSSTSFIRLRASMPFFHKRWIVLQWVSQTLPKNSNGLRKLQYKMAISQTLQPHSSLLSKQGPKSREIEIEASLAFSLGFSIRLCWGPDNQIHLSAFERSSFPSLAKNRGLKCSQVRCQKNVKNHLVSVS